MTARLARLNPVIAGEDAGYVIFEFESGARALFDRNRLVDHPADNRRLTMGEMLVEGSAGVVRLRPKPVDSNRDHLALVEAIANRDAERAGAIHRQHRRRHGAMLAGLLESPR